MKTRWILKGIAVAGFLLAFGLFVSSLSLARSGEDKVYSKRRDLPLLESASASSKTAAKAKWNEELSVSKREGRWLKVSGEDGEGWVYSGNVATEKLPEENQNDMPMKASGMTAAAAGRGLSDAADAYAGRHSLSEVAAQVSWAEKLNAGISKEEARAYLKSHKLGEYSGAK